MYVVWRVSCPEVTRLINIFCIHLRISKQMFNNVLQFLTTCLSPPPTQSSASCGILLPFLEGEEWTSVSFASWPVHPVSCRPWWEWLDQHTLRLPWSRCVCWDHFLCLPGRLVFFWSCICLCLVVYVLTAPYPNPHSKPTQVCKYSLGHLEVSS